MMIDGPNLAPDRVGAVVLVRWRCLPVDSLALSRQHSTGTRARSLSCYCCCCRRHTNQIVCTIRFDLIRSSSKSILNGRREERLARARACKHTQPCVCMLVSRGRFAPNSAHNLANLCTFAMRVARAQSHCAEPMAEYRRTFSTFVYISSPSRAGRAAALPPSASKH